jgi:hypothetical protein
MAKPLKLVGCDPLVPAMPAKPFQPRQIPLLNTFHRQKRIIA